MIGTSVIKELTSISRVDENLSNEMANEKDPEYFREERVHRMIFRDLIHSDILQ